MYIHIVISEKIPNSPAFKEELQISSFNKHSFDLKLFELPSSNFVVREVPVDYIYKNEDKISMVEVAQDLNSLFDELRIKYEINAPVKFLVADDELGQPTVFTLTEKIKTNKELSFDYVGYRHILERLFNYLKDELDLTKTCIYSSVSFLSPHSICTTKSLWVSSQISR